MAIVTLLQELFSGRAMRPATRRRGGRADVEQVRMPRIVAGAASSPMPAVRPCRCAGADRRTRSGVRTRPPTVADRRRRHRARDLRVAGGRRGRGQRRAGGARGVRRRPARAAARSHRFGRCLAAHARQRASARHHQPAGLRGAVHRRHPRRPLFRLPRHAGRHRRPGHAPCARPTACRSSCSRSTTAYDVVIVECGPADAEGIRRLVAEGTEIMVSVLEPDDEIAAAAPRNSRPAAIGTSTLVTPGGYLTGAELAGARTAHGCARTAGPCDRRVRSRGRIASVVGAVGGDAAWPRLRSSLASFQTIGLFLMKAFSRAVRRICRASARPLIVSGNDHIEMRAFRGRTTAACRARRRR